MSEAQSSDPSNAKERLSSLLRPLTRIEPYTLGSLHTEMMKIRARFPKDPVFDVGPYIVLHVAQYGWVKYVGENVYFETQANARLALWLRDWNLPEPRTMSEIHALLRKVREKDPGDPAFQVEVDPVVYLVRLGWIKRTGANAYIVRIPDDARKLSLPPPPPAEKR